MADKTGIEWTDASWNPIVGCSIVSPGCTNCYAMSQAARIVRCSAGAGRPTHYQDTVRQVKDTPVWTGKVALAPDSILTQPLRWKAPRKIFVNSMGDLFHEDVPDAWIDRVFAVMALSPQHSFQILTKRSARMRAYLTQARSNGKAEVRHRLAWDATIGVMNTWCPEWRSEGIHGPHRSRAIAAFEHWPLPNVWLGVSTEDQRRAEERVPDLLATPAAIRFVSAEPLLGPIDFTSLDINGDSEMDALKPMSWADQIEAWRDSSPSWEEDFLDWFNLSVMPKSGNLHPTLDWIIVGGESGPRPMHPDWARAIRDQCSAAGTAFFFKQWGAWAPLIDRERDDPDWRRDYSYRFADNDKTRWLNLDGGCGFHGERFHVMGRASKARAGRLLDGVEHNAMPELRS